MSSAGFEPAIPAIERLQTYNLDHTVAESAVIHNRLALLLFRFILVKNVELQALYSTPRLTQIWKLFCLATKDLRYTQAFVFIL